MAFEMKEVKEIPRIERATEERDCLTLTIKFFRIKPNELSGKDAKDAWWDMGTVYLPKSKYGNKKVRQDLEFHHGLEKDLIAKIRKILKKQKIRLVRVD